MAEWRLSGGHHEHRTDWHYPIQKKTLTHTHVIQGTNNVLVPALVSHQQSLRKKSTTAKQDITVYGHCIVDFKWECRQVCLLND